MKISMPKVSQIKCCCGSIQFELLVDNTGVVMTQCAICRNVKHVRDLSQLTINREG